ncbi:MAG: hypothetical protein Q8936_14275 [Bacillota bacterium]|nr:hypothetical protein [Bacillota bacterium]
MALRTLDVKPIDPYLKTGPSRIMSGPVRMRTVTLDTPYGEYATWLYVGVGGDVNITEWDGTTVTLVGLVAGVWHPIYSLQVNSAGTAATNIVWGS